MSAEERAAARVREAGGQELVERLLHLDATRTASAKRETRPRRPERGARLDVDVAIAGGGLSVLIAPLLTSLGARVAVLDRARAASAHREWNASEAELAALTRSGLFSERDVAELVVARYREGVCAFHGGGRYPVRGVLDHAVDAGELLRRTRSIAEARGVTFHDEQAVIGHATGGGGVRLRVRAASGAEHDLTAAVMLDARGAASPYASADLVCPTVGGVLGGLAEGSAPDEVDPQVGEILATIDPADQGRQHVWEAFPGRRGQTTVYLFYYAATGEAGSLLSLYARFFEAMPRYKRGSFDLIRPTFGYIPGWSRLSAPPRSPERRVVLVGDAAARHSPLTYCGFGAMLRSFEPAARRVATALEGGLRSLDSLDVLAHDAPIHAMTGALARLLASGAMKGDAPNELLDAAFASLHAMGNDAYASLLQDTMTPPSFVEFLRKTAAKRPRVYREALAGMGPLAAARWGARVARELARAAAA